MITRRIFQHINHLKYIFITGISSNEKLNKIIKKEINLFKDIIVFNVVNSYYNCSIIMSCFYIYIHNNCQKIVWVIKLDIDTYFNSKLLLKIISNCSSNISVIGKINKKPRLKCNTNYKWSITCINKTNSYIQVPSYPFGPGFIFKFSSIKCIYTYFIKRKKIIWIEDVFFGILMKYCNLSFLDISKYTSITYKPINDLSISDNKLFIHGLYPIEIYLANKRR